MQAIEQMEKCFFVHRLHRAGDVFVMLRQRFIRVARRPEQPGQLRRIQLAHPGFAVFPLVFHFLAMMAKMVKVQAERATFFEAHDLPHFGHEARLTVGCQPHHLVLVAVIRKTEILGQRLIENAQRMRKIDLVFDLDAIATADAPGRTGKVAKAIHRHGHRLFERRHQKRRAQMRKMVLDVPHPGMQGLAGKGPQQLFGHPRALALVAKAVEHQRKIRTVHCRIG